MGSLAQASKNLEEQASDKVLFEGPADWTQTPDSLLQALHVAFRTGEKELRMYVGLLCLCQNTLATASPAAIPMKTVQEFLGKGFRCDSDFRGIRTRLEKLNLLRIERVSGSSATGGATLKYILMKQHGDCIPSGQPLMWKTIGKELSKINEKANKAYAEKDNAKQSEIIKDIAIKGAEPMLDGVGDWESPIKPRVAEKVRGDLNDPIETWNAAHRLNYFMKGFKEANRNEYYLNSRGRAEDLMRSLPVTNQVFKLFIDWLVSTKQIDTHGLLGVQLNRYFKVGEVQPEDRLEDGVAGEYLKVPHGNGTIIVVQEIMGRAVVGQRIRALEAIALGLITVEQVVKWDLCPTNLLRVEGLL